MFDETPKVEFSVTENGVVVYRDAIVYDSIADLRADSKEERQAKFQERYDNWKASIAESAQAQEVIKETEQIEEQ